MAAFEVAKTVGGTDIAAEIGVTTVASITIGATSGDDRISQAYDHLYLTFSSRNGRTAYFQYLKYEFNADNGFNYSFTTLQAENATPISHRGTPADSIRGIQGDNCASNSLLAGTFSANTLWIPDYANTANFKSTISTTSIPNNSATNSEWMVSLTAGLWQGTPAGITQILLKPGQLGAEFMQYTSYVLYGITGA
jgi:hypothetical protein